MMMKNPEDINDLSKPGSLGSPHARLPVEEWRCVCSPSNQTREKKLTGDLWIFAQGDSP